MVRPRPSPRSIEHPSADKVSLQRLMEALVDPVRRSVIAQLAQADEDLSCGAFELPVTRSTATHHFNMLREAGVIRQYYVGTTKMNTLRTGDLDERFPGLLTALVVASVRDTDLDLG